MRLGSDVLVHVVALLHFWFLALEAFFWTRPLGLKTFGHSLEKAKLTRVLALNQGAYNGFLATGLLFAFYTSNREMIIFLLICIILAGIVGGLTFSKKIIVVQSLPAVAALVSLCIS